MMRWALPLIVLGLGGGLLATSPVYVPTYAARFAPGADEGLLREILAELRAIRVELAAQRQAVTPLERPPASLAALVAARCAGCHAEAVAERKGDGFVLLTAQGQVPLLSAGDRRRILRLVNADDETRRMPKGAPPLTDGEKRALQGFLATNMEKAP
jgi:hypothetical protein